jgi:hypothetical protein
MSKGQEPRPLMPSIYLGHPLVGDGSKEWGDMEKNVERYLRFVALFTNAGFLVVSWIHHYETHRRGWTQGSAEFYLERDFHLIDMARVFVPLAPLPTSQGLVAEWDYSEKQVEVTAVMPTIAVWMKHDYLPLPDPSVVSHDELRELRRIRGLSYEQALDLCLTEVRV